MDRLSIKDEANQALTGNRLVLLLFIIITDVISGSLSRFYIGVLLVPLTTAGLFFVTKDMLVGRKIEANRFFMYKDFMHALKVIAVNLLYSLLFIVGLAFFIIPGFYFLLAYSQATFIMAEHGDLGIIDAMKKSREMMNGYKLDLLVFALSFIGHILLIIVTFGIYAFYILPYFQACSVNYYLTLKSL